MRGALTRGFVTMWMTGLLLQGGYWIATTALQWQVAIIPGSTPRDLGTLYFGQLLPMMLMTPVAGVLVDYCNRKLLLVVALTAIAVAGAAGAILGDAMMLSFAVCLALASVYGLIMALQSPIFHVLIPRIVPLTSLNAAVSLYAVAQNSARTIGPMIAGGMLLVGGVAFSLWGVAAIAVLGMVFVFLLPPQPAVRPQQKESILAQLSGGFTVLAAKPGIRRAIVLVALNGAFGLSYASMLSVVAKGLGEGEGGFSLLMGAAGLGAIAGAVVPYPRVRQLGDVSWLLLIAVAGLIGVALAPNLTLAALSSFVISASGISVNTRLNVMVQRQLEDAVRGRVMSLYSWAWGGSLPLGGLLIGFIGDATSVPMSFLVLAGLLAATAVYNWATARSVQ